MSDVLTGVLTRCGAVAAVAALVAVAIAASAPPPARAGDTGPVIVIPSRPGIPIVINGRDASYAVVEGDWGLARPGAVPQTVIGGRPVRPSPAYEPQPPYLPRYGAAPPRGRHEVEPPPNRRLPQPAPSFSRSWSSSSMDADAGSSPTMVDPATYPPSFDPQVFVEPRHRRR